MRVWDRLLVFGLIRRLPENTKLLAIERGSSDALGEVRKTTAVLTEDALILATPVRMRTILTTVPRADIRSVDMLEADRAAIAFDDYRRAQRRVVEVDLRRFSDRGRILAALGDRTTEE
jgi:hypothetical protein